MILVANWKAYVTDFNRAKALFDLGKKMSRKTSCDIVLAPPAPFLSALAVKNASKVAFASQDVSATLGGATTGEVTASMVASLGATYTLIGHSERRARGDGEVEIAAKLSHAFAQDLTPIICIGEQERDSEGRYLTLLREQITSALATLSPKERTKVVLAYEPLWAIGKTADQSIGQNDLAEMVLYIHKILAELLPGKSSAHTRVLYGGSVEPGNIRALAGASAVDGFLVGHASTDPSTFEQLVKELS